MEQTYNNSWFGFDKATGGWWVNDISRAANSGGTSTGDSDYGHRVQIISFNTHGDQLPDPQGYEVLLCLPEFNQGGKRTHFTDIASVRATLYIDWTKWDNPSKRANFEIILQDLRHWSQHSEGGHIGEILDGIDDETTSHEEYPNPITMIATTKMYEKQPPPSGMELWANYFKVIVTNFTLANRLPASPVRALIHLLDNEGNIIPLSEVDD